MNPSCGCLRIIFLKAQASLHLVDSWDSLFILSSVVDQDTMYSSALAATYLQCTAHDIQKFKKIWYKIIKACGDRRWTILVPGGQIAGQVWETDDKILYFSMDFSHFFLVWLKVWRNMSCPSHDLWPMRLVVWEWIELAAGVCDNEQADDRLIDTLFAIVLDLVAGDFWKVWWTSCTMRLSGLNWRNSEENSTWLDPLTLHELSVETDKK